MANNRMFVVHVPTGYCVTIGKRMGWGWYMGSPETLAERLNRLYEMVEHCERDATWDHPGEWQDCFALAMEDCHGNPYALNDWRYMESDIEGIGRIELTAIPCPHDSYTQRLDGDTVTVKCAKCGWLVSGVIGQPWSTPEHT